MSFDILAPHYRWMEFILAGEKLQRCRTEFLGVIPLRRNILLLGEGDGRFLVDCRRRFPDARITCVDASERMLDRARRELARHTSKTVPVKFIQADILNWTPAGEVHDLVVTNFFLDCFRPDQLEMLISRLALCAAPDAIWLLADFQKPSGGILKRTRVQLILWVMYAFFRAVTRLPAQKLTAPDRFLQQAGFVLHHRVEFDWGLLHSDWWKRRAGAVAK